MWKMKDSFGVLKVQSFTRLEYCIYSSNLKDIPGKYGIKRGRNQEDFYSYANLPIIWN